MTTKELFLKEKIREGDEIFFVGLFTPHIGQQKNYPITRFGRIALLTDEKIAWKDLSGERLMDLYLAECQSYGGNSGSPVFFYLEATRNPGILAGPPKFLLAGIMQGYFNDAQKVEFIQTQATPISLQNMGIAAIVPAYKLYEILFSEKLTNVRAKKIAELSSAAVSPPVSETV